MRALARKQKRDLAAQAAVGTGSRPARRLVDGTLDPADRPPRPGAQRHGRAQGQPLGRIEWRRRPTYASSRRTGRARRNRRRGLSPSSGARIAGEQDWVLDEANEMAPPRARRCRQPFGRKLVSFEGDGKSMGNSTFSRNPGAREEDGGFFTGIPPRKSLCLQKVRWTETCHAFGRDHSGLTNEAPRGAGQPFRGPREGATLTWRRARRSRCARRRLWHSGAASERCRCLSRDFLKRTRTGPGR